MNENTYTIDQVCLLNRELILLNMSLLRKLCNLNGDEFGYRVAGITKQSVSKYEKSGDLLRKSYPYTKKNKKKFDTSSSPGDLPWIVSYSDSETTTPQEHWDNCKNLLNPLLYIAIRHYLDFECQKDKKREDKKRRTLGAVLHLIDNFCLLNEEKQGELLKILFDLRNTVKGKEGFDSKKDAIFYAKLEKRFGKLDYDSALWYKKYQKEVKIKLEKGKSSNDPKQFIKKLYCEGRTAQQITELIIPILPFLQKDIQKELEKNSTTEEVHRFVSETITELNQSHKVFQHLTHDYNIDDVANALSTETMSVSSKKANKLLLAYLIEKEEEIEKKGLISLLIK